jgi:hypothetical protein
MAERKGTRDVYAGNSQVNALSFFVESALKGKINTAVPVVVTGVDPDALRLTCKPLVCQRDAENNALPMANLYELPYMRLQGGKVAIIADPVEGDIGLAVFAKQDTSNIKTGTTEPVQAGSFRFFDMADGFYFGGFLNQPPETFVELTQDRVITVHAPQSIILDAPSVEVTGSLHVAGSLSNNIVLETHTHGGVEPGGGNTGGPN